MTRFVVAKIAFRARPFPSEWMTIWASTPVRAVDVFVDELDLARLADGARRTSS
jgi:hypothetical protein